MQSISRRITEVPMIRKLSLSAVAVSMFASLAAAEVDFDRGGFDIKAEIADMAVTAPEAQQDKGFLSDLFGKKEPAEWTIMVFSSAKNDLEPYLLKDLNEMEMVGSTAKLNIVAEVGRIDGYDSSDGDWKGVRRYLITKDNDKTKMGSKLLQDMGMTDMGDYRNLAAFGKWAKQKYPAKRYMLIVSNHGSGWEKGLVRQRVSKGISYDEQSGNHINTPQLALALKEIGKVDVFSTDACLMQMAEVVYEIKDFADYIVGSEETEPGDGYTYNTFLGPIAARPTMTALEVGKQTVNAYADHYDGINQGYTQALARGGATVAGLLPVTNAFVEAVMASGEKALAKTSRDATVAFAMDENKDLYDFTRRVVEGSQNADVKAKGQALMNYITNTMVLHNRTRDSQGGYWSGPVPYTLAKGMAAYFPSSTLGDGYADLAWAKASKWDEFGSWINQP
ncbi:MAG: clostripain-related cysteine peptidase [Elusimicrobiales bacterium]|nr:clostripain-related cysteine peptidase [Elusimicrobiales bacterium]